MSMTGPMGMLPPSDGVFYSPASNARSCSRSSASRSRIISAVGPWGNSRASWRQRANLSLSASFSGSRSIAIIRWLTPCSSLRQPGSSESGTLSCERKDWVVTPHEYLELAERYRKVLETTTDTFTRHHLEAMERSHRTLAESERALRTSGWIVDALDKLGEATK